MPLSGILSLSPFSILFSLLPLLTLPWQPHLGEVVGTPCLGDAEAFADVIGFAAVVQKMQVPF